MLQTMQRTPQLPSLTDGACPVALTLQLWRERWPGGAEQRAEEAYGQREERSRKWNLVVELGPELTGFGQNEEHWKKK